MNGGSGRESADKNLKNAVLDFVFFFHIDLRMYFVSWATRDQFDLSKQQQMDINKMDVKHGQGRVGSDVVVLLDATFADPSHL